MVPSLRNGNEKQNRKEKNNFQAIKMEKNLRNDIDMNLTHVGSAQVKQQAVIFKCFDYCIFTP